MPRRSKPPGLERWMWAEINAGRRMSKAEKRWNRMAKNLNWDQRADGAYQAPPQAVPFLVAMLVLMFVLAILAPNGVNNAHGGEGAAAAIVLLMLGFVMVLLVAFGHNYAGSASPVRPTPSPTPGPITPPPLPSKPIVRPALMAATRAIGKVLTFRWVSRLSQWAQPIVWSLVITAPAVAMMIEWLAGRSPLGDAALCLVFVVAGAATGGLVHDALEAARLRREEEEAERTAVRERFRVELIRELRNCPVRDFDFGAFIARESIPRFEADHAAAAVYRGLSDRVVADGVISAEERRKLDTLANVLEIGPERVQVIEDAAKSERFRRELDDVLADGVVTDDEAYNLAFLRYSLGISESHWQAAQDRLPAGTFNPVSIEGGQQHA